MSDSSLSAAHATSQQEDASLLGAAASAAAAAATDANACFVVGDLVEVMHVLRVFFPQLCGAFSSHSSSFWSIHFHSFFCAFIIIIIS